MALGLWFTSTWGWPCSACGVASPPEEGYSFFPAPSLPPGCICFSANWHSPSVFNSLSWQGQSAHSGTSQSLLLCSHCFAWCFFWHLSKGPRQKYRAYWDWTTFRAHRWMLSSRPGRSRVKCSHLFAGSVTALPLKLNVFFINPNTVTLRSRALLRGGFNPIIRRRYGYMWMLVDPWWLIFFLCHVLSL